MSIDKALYRMDEYACTVIVAAIDSLPAAEGVSGVQADFYCDGVADEVQINAALTFVNTLGGGLIVLLRGTYTLADPITFPGNNLTLEGMGISTFIDGDGLATTEHGIVISGRDDCEVRDLSIQTEDGGGKTCHCIFIEDGSDHFTLRNITVVDSDSDGIHIEGTNILTGRIYHCDVDDADGHGIYVDMDAGQSIYRLDIGECHITGTGAEGIEFAASGGNFFCIVNMCTIYLCGANGILATDYEYGEIIGNLLYQNTLSAIASTSTGHLQVTNNICYNNTQYGITFADVDEAIVMGNVCHLNDSGDTGNYSGLTIDSDSTLNLITGNHLCHNHGNGMHIVGPQNSIHGNYVYNNDKDGIYIENNECLINNNYVTDNSQDLAGSYSGILLTGTADRCQVNDNYISDTGGNTQGDGIHLLDGAVNVQIVGNYCYNHYGAGALNGSGIYLAANNDNCQIKNNYCYLNDGYGIEIVAATCNSNVVENNSLIGNGTGAINDSGTDTVLPEIVENVIDSDTFIGDHPAAQLLDGVTNNVRFEFRVPMNFQELVTARVIVVPGGSGDMDRAVTSMWGKWCSGEAYNAVTDSIAAGIVAVDADDLECIEIASAFDGDGGIAAGDEVGFTFTRRGGEGADTVNATCYVLKFIMQYV